MDVKAQTGLELRIVEHHEVTLSVVVETVTPRLEVGPSRVFGRSIIEAFNRNLIFVRDAGDKI
jgi:hypothetical protein